MWEEIKRYGLWVDSFNFFLFELNAIIYIFGGWKKTKRGMEWNFEEMKRAKQRIHILKR